MANLLPFFLLHPLLLFRPPLGRLGRIT
jgi:hypothetical protein